MKTANVLALALLGVASFPLLAQQPASSEPPPGSAAPPAAEQAPPPQEQQAPAAQAPQATEQSAPAATPAAQMSPVTGELVNELDSKTAKNGDAVVIKTKSAVTTADGTQIPKGTKLIGRVVGVKPTSADSVNSQVALQFDRAELKGGQSVAIRSELQSLAPSDSEVSANSGASPASSGVAAAGSAPSASGGSMQGSSPAGSSAATQPPMSSNGAPAATTNAGPAAGTVVARTGNIAIRTTSIQGVLLAVNEPGQVDPRMAQSSGILLGAKREIHLEQGTNVVIGVAGSGASAGGR
ncbi:MAG: hypothetical protein WCC26_06110 [Terracidiphilus sp.]